MASAQMLHGARVGVARGRPFRRRRLAPGAARCAKDADGAQSPAGGSRNASLADRIAAGEYGRAAEGPSAVERTAELRRSLAAAGPGGRALALAVARGARMWRAASKRRMPEATGDIREIIGEPVFVPLYNLFLAYGRVFRLSFGPKSFVVVSDPAVAKDILLTNASAFSKGLLAEILEFVMGTGLIPADGEVWRVRRRAIVPALHRKYVQAMVGLFAERADLGCRTLVAAVRDGTPIEMENFFSRLTLDIIGKAVFNYDFDSLKKDDPVIEAVYITLREAEYRSIAVFPYWNVPILRAIVPRQRKVTAALQLINETLDTLILRTKKLVEEEDEEFVEEYLNKADPSILHFLIASGEQVTSKQLRDDLMTMLIAGHETTAAVLTWTFYLLATHPEKLGALQAEVDDVVGDRQPTLEDLPRLSYTSRVISEAMRLYPQPPVLLRRALKDVTLGQYAVKEGADIFISVWNLHRSPGLWDEPNEFQPERFAADKPMPNETTEEWRYLPFGGGTRKCIGDQFAMFESIVSLAMLVRRFDFALAPGREDVGMTTGATIHTRNGLYLTLKERRPEPPVGTAAEEPTQEVSVTHA